ncbi:MAG TPA: CotH kinase family protein [Aggregicoccus sp.]|nr:CotH kinase family protein [Aggregicoccus sp.]
MALLLWGCGPEVTAGPEEPAAPPASNEEPPPPPDDGDPDDPGDPDVPAPLTYPLACHPIYSEDLLPTFELEVSEQNWALLRQEFQEDPSRETEFPATFRYAGEVYPDATIRLRGNHSQCGDKMQFAIAFNKVDRAGRFRGLRRLNLDHGGCYHLEERLALSYLRDVGLPTACANHARLMVNGAYYGLFSNIEHINQDFLKRQFPGAENDGDLWKSGHVLKTNEETTPENEIETFWRVRTLPEIDAYVDLDEAVLEWAAEAVLPACDNYWLYAWNYYLYDHPQRGLLWVPTDLDCSWALLEDEVERDIFFPTPLQKPADVVLADPAWRQKYLAAVRHSVSRMDVAKLEARADRWWAQIAEAARTDPHVPYTEAQVQRFKDGLRRRRVWLDAWVREHAAP